MTEQERELVIEYLKSKGGIVHSLMNDETVSRIIDTCYYTYEFRFYAINHAWKAVVTELKKEAYRRWINLIVKYK